MENTKSRIKPGDLCKTTSSQTSDILYFQKKITEALKVPSEYFSFDEVRCNDEVDFIPDEVLTETCLFIEQIGTNAYILINGKMEMRQLKELKPS